MTKTQAQPINPILVSNVILLGIFGLLLSFYIVQANMIAADKYKVKILNEKLTSLNEVRTSLVAQRSETEDPSELMEFARPTVWLRPRISPIFLKTAMSPLDRKT